MLDQMLKESGVDLSPEPDVFGILSKAEEENVLSRLWNDKMFIALLRKYAEGANKAMIMAVKNQNHEQALRFNGQFFCYNSMIIKSRRAALRIKNEPTEDSDQI